MKHRIEWIDTLRGFAILLMILDHILVYILNIHIISGLRIITRISFPLFMLIIGYLLPTRKTNRIINRIITILLIAIILLPFNIYLNGIGNVLFSISIAILILIYLPPELGILSITLLPLDLSKMFIEYGIMLTIFIISLGILIRKKDYMGIFIGLTLGLLVFIFNYNLFNYITWPLIGLFFALVIFISCIKFNLKNKLLELFGKWPLEIYFIHLFIIAIYTFLF